MLSLREERGLSVALFLVTLATLMFEVLLTRVFSLTMWYHFAFMAISMAMLGMTAGALIVFLRPNGWPDSALLAGMGRSALLFSASMVAMVFLHTLLYVPSPALDALPLALTFTAAAVPFVFSGIFVSLALTRFPSRLGRLYAVDLAGAATGCLLVIAALHWLDGVGAVLACAGLAAAAASLLLRGRQRSAAALTSGALALATVWVGVHLARYDLSAFPIRYIKGADQQEIEYERWNSFSRIAVMQPNKWDVPAWSLSAEFKGSLEFPSRWLQIDAGAGTQLIGFDGDLSKVEFLRWDLVNFVHHLRPNASVCIVGAGGGRDILTARLFGQKRIVAVEINGDILGVVNGRFGDFTGHLDRYPGVTIVNDEARSYLTRTPERFDIVQVTFIDTWAATAAGAYTLTENALYTVEGWKVFIDRLEDGGLLAVSRGANAELDRLVGLGREALRAAGVSRPEDHMVLVVNRRARWPQSFGPMGMLLVSKTPFQQEDLARIRTVAERLRFDIDLQPGFAKTRLLQALATGRGMEMELALSLTNYDAPTDDQPFFFNMLRPSGWLVTRGEDGIGHQSVTILADLLLLVAGLTLACIALPFAFSRSAAVSRADGPLLAFFAAIGLGFMLVEIAMLQRLIVFLGHPVYSLSVILFTLLLAGGVGSWLSARVPDDRVAAYGCGLVALLVVVLAACGLALGLLMAHFQAAETPVRIAVCGGLLAIMGVPMGMAFPLGMRLAARLRPALGPWLWGVNGAVSVLASVLAVVIAMGAGISASYWAGVAAYGAACLAFVATARRSAPA